MPTKFDNSFKLNEEQIEQLKQIVPEAFKDGLVDIGALSEALSGYSGEDLDIDDNLFGLYWPGKRQAKRVAAIPPVGTLVPVPGDGVNEETTKNIYIEGENLEVLKIMRKAYLGKIKMIYIDPPYNTGNDFIYPDDFSETEESFKRRTGQIDENGVSTTTNKSSEGRFHSKWCSMMYPRLRLARDLLTDDGVIFINIDENEITNLQMICEEIYGIDNNLGIIIWDKRNPKGSVKGISYQHESILLFSKNAVAFSENCKMMHPKKNAKTMLNKATQLFNKICSSYSFEQANLDYTKWVNAQTDFTGGEKAYNCFDKEGNVFRPVSMAAPDKPETRSHRPLLHPITNKPCPVPAKGWRFPDKSMDELLANGEILFGKDESTQPCRKYLLKENIDEQIPSLLYYGGSDTDLLSSFKIPFETPKVVNIIIDHIRSLTSSNSIILDFFSGSSTTAHAVMQLNAEDGGNRQFIMVQLQEKCNEKTEAYKAGFKNICEIGKERIRRAGKKIKEEAGLNAKTLDTGFKVFRLAPSNFKPVGLYTGTNVKELPDWFSADPLVEGWKPENLITEVMLKEGFSLDSAITKLDAYKKNKVYQVSSGYCDHSLMICFDVHIENDTIEKLDLGELDIFICLDSAITDQAKARLDDKGRIVVI